MQALRQLGAAAFLAAAVILFPSIAGGAEPKTLTVADFNSGTKPDNLGGDFGCWIRDPNDPMQGCIEAFDKADRFGPRGYSLRLIYSVDSDKPAFGGLWMRLQNLNATQFDNLAFRVRGDSRMGFTTVFKVELKDAVDQSSHFYVRGVTDQWQDIVIPLKDFEGMANLNRLKEFVMTFEDTTATAKKGVIYLDDIRFTRNGP